MARAPAALGLLLGGPRPAGRGRPRAHPDRRPHRRHAAGGGRLRVGLREHRRRAGRPPRRPWPTSWPASSRRSRAATCSWPSAAPASSCGAPPARRCPSLPSPRTGLEGLFWTPASAAGRACSWRERTRGARRRLERRRGRVRASARRPTRITRILTGQLDAYVDIGPAIIAAHPSTEAEFRRVGQRPRALQLALRPGRGLAALPRGRACR